MAQYIDPEGWVSFEDYVHGVRKKVENKIPIAERLEMPPEPESWVSELDYIVHNVRRYIPPPDPETYNEHIKITPPEPPPPEAFITMEDALDEVMAPTKNVLLASKLMDMAREDQRELAAGLIDQEEVDRRQVAASIILNNHNIRKKRIADWYLENHFRPFGEQQSAEQEAKDSEDILPEDS
ncbi:MAG: hypothetical protein HQL69_17805 [Magnetococcales bacterium]|nr:hypothetical protein [Magnetococcales bacterium]